MQETQTMLRHYVLTLDPNAKYDWDRRTLRHPLTADCPSLTGLVIAQVGQQTGQFLVAVTVTVTVLETVDLDRPGQPLLPDGVSSEPGLLETEPYATELVPAVQHS